MEVAGSVDGGVAWEDKFVEVILKEYGSYTTHSILAYLIGRITSHNFQGCYKKFPPQAYRKGKATY